MAAPTVEELIARLSPDLQGLLDSRKVHRQVSRRAFKDWGSTNVAMLSAVATDRDSLQALAKDSPWPGCLQQEGMQSSDSPSCTWHGRRRPRE